MSAIAPSQPVTTAPPASARSMSPGAFGAWMLGLGLYAVAAVGTVSFVARYNANLGLPASGIVMTPQGMAAQLTVEFKAMPDGRAEELELELRTGGPGQYAFERIEWSRLALLDADPRTMPGVPPPVGLVTTFVVPLTQAQVAAAANPSADRPKVWLRWGYARSLRGEL